MDFKIERIFKGPGFAETLFLGTCDRLRLPAAIRAGINVPGHLVRVYIISSMFAAVAGVLYVFRAGIGNFTTMGSSYELFAIAGVVIGGASLMGGKGKIGGTVIGILILMTLETGLNITGIPSFIATSPRG